jgi:hypothetical protein
VLDVLLLLLLVRVQVHVPALLHVLHVHVLLRV